MEKFGFREISVVEERLRQNAMYFSKISKRVIVLSVIFLLSAFGMICIHFCFNASSFTLIVKTALALLLCTMFCCLFFTYLTLRNGRWLYLKRSYRSRVNKILRQFSLELLNDGKGTVQFDRNLLPNVNYNYNLYKLEAKTRLKQ